MLRTTSADLSISHHSLRHLFLSQTTGAWNVVSMEEVKYSIESTGQYIQDFFSIILPPVVGK